METEDFYSIDTSINVKLNSNLLAKFHKLYPARGFLSEIVRLRIRQLIKEKETVNGNSIEPTIKQTAGIAIQGGQIPSRDDNGGTARIHRADEKKHDGNTKGVSKQGNVKSRKKYEGKNAERRGDAGKNGRSRKNKVT